MEVKFRPALILVFVFLSICSFAQNNVNVNLFTGTANITIPIHRLSVGDISIPIGLQYSATGLRVENDFEVYGIGWDLNAEASVSRQLKGYPDDLDNSSKKGWLKASNIGSSVENFTVANVNASPACTDETTDYTALNGFSFTYDTEPDIFSVNAPGLSCQFIFDKNHDIKLLQYQDIKIVCSYNPVDATIDSFVVTNENGLKYHFSLRDTSSLKFVNYLSSFDVLKRDDDYYRGLSGPRSGSGVKFASKWYLSRIDDISGNSVRYSYCDTLFSDSGPNFKRSEIKSIIKFNSGLSTFDLTNLYERHPSTVEKRISKITIVRVGQTEPENGDIEFVWAGQSTRSQLNRIILRDVGRYVDLTYLTRTRTFLQSIKFYPGSTSDYDEYHFWYNDVSESSNTSYFTGHDSLTFAQDYWGYYNGANTNTNLYPKIWVHPTDANYDEFRIFEPESGYLGGVYTLNGANREVNSTYIVNGTLDKFSTPAGGFTWLEYEPNNFIDKDTYLEVIGGGIRVKKITYNDGLNSKEITNYDYDDPATFPTVTSGKAISVPRFAFAIPNSNTYSTTQDQINNSVYRSEYNLSEEPTAILYSKVSVSKSDGGKTVYEFNTGGTWGVSNSDWSESISYFSRSTVPSPCTAIQPAFLKKGKNLYPFPHNVNDQYLKGLLLKQTSYSEAGNAVMEETYTYTTSHTPTITQGLVFDKNFGGLSYAKYDIVTYTSKLLNNKTTKTYSTASGSTSNYKTETENYYYESSEHKNPTKITKVNSLSGSSGVESKTYIKYAKDYTYPINQTADDDYALGIKLLQDVNKNVKIESYSTVTEPGGSEKVINAELFGYQPFYNAVLNTSIIRPIDIWSFHSPNGLLLSSFTASSISFPAGAFQKYSGYKVSNTLLEFEQTGFPISTKSLNRIVKSVIYDPTISMKVGDIENASPSQVNYTSFDYGNSNKLTYSGGSSSIGSGHYSASSLTWASATTLSGSFSNAGNHVDIIFSCWIKSNSNSGQLTISSSSFSSQTLNFTASSEWKFYQIKFAKPSSSSTISYTVQTSANISIDDILLFPGNATVNTYSYDVKSTTLSGVTAVVLSAKKYMNGAATLLDYDEKNRVLYSRDAFNNITLMNIYKAKGGSLTLASPSITYTTPLQASRAITFTANGNSGVYGIKYNWSFGDGTTAETTIPTYSKTYSSDDVVNVSCTVSAPGYSSATGYTGNIMIQPIPLVCISGIILKQDDGTCVQSSSPCTGVTGNCFSTKFKVYSMPTGDLSGATYSWELALLSDPDNWSSVGTNSNLLTISFTSSTESYKVRCWVTTSYNTLGVTDESIVENNYQ